MVVTVFMLGLGLGSLLGGRLSRAGGWRLPLLFGITEIFIGAFGLASEPLFQRIAGLTAGAAGLEVGLAAFMLLLVPTLFMGATLPMLAGYAADRSGNVGRSLGMLYFANTFGSAIGCVAAAQLLFGLLGKHASVQLAAGINFLVAACVLAALARKRP
jgi:MFS family permease